MWFIWTLFEKDIFGDAKAQCHTAVEVLNKNTDALRGELRNWYAQYQVANPTSNLSRLQDLRPTMLGTKAEPALRTKAAETFGLLLFSKDSSASFVAKLGAEGRDIVRLAATLARHMQIMDDSPRVFSAASLQEPRVSPPIRTDINTGRCFVTCGVDGRKPREKTCDKEFRRTHRQARRLWLALGLPLAPKDHLWAHMVERPRP